MKRVITAKNAANASNMGSVHLERASPYCGKTTNSGDGIASNFACKRMLADERADQDLPRYRRSPRQ